MGNRTGGDLLNQKRVKCQKKANTQAFGVVNVLKVEGHHREVVNIPCLLKLNDEDRNKRTQLRHTNLLSTLAWEESSLQNNGFTCYFDWAEISLAQVVQGRNQLNWQFPEDDIIRIAKEVLSCLNFLSQHNIPNGNLEPSTIFHDTIDNCIKIYDNQLILGQNASYYLARNQFFPHISSGMDIERMPYVSPEILYGIQLDDIEIIEKFKHQTDVFQLGLTLLELCTFKDSRQLVDVKAKRYQETSLQERILSLKPTYSPYLIELLQSMLVLDPRNRPLSAKLLSQLEQSQSIIKPTAAPFQNSSNIQNCCSSNNSNNIAKAQASPTVSPKSKILPFFKNQRREEQQQQVSKQLQYSTEKQRNQANKSYQTSSQQQQSTSRQLNARHLDSSQVQQQHQPYIQSLPKNQSQEDQSQQIPQFQQRPRRNQSSSQQSPQQPFSVCAPHSTQQQSASSSQQRAIREVEPFQIQSLQQSKSMQQLQSMPITQQQIIQLQQQQQQPLYQKQSYFNAESNQQDQNVSAQLRQHHQFNQNPLFQEPLNQHQEQNYQQPSSPFKQLDNSFSQSPSYPQYQQQQSPLSSKNLGIQHHPCQLSPSAQQSYLNQQPRPLRQSLLVTFANASPRFSSVSPSPSISPEREISPGRIINAPQISPKITRIQRLPSPPRISPHSLKQRPFSQINLPRMERQPIIATGITANDIESIQQLLPNPAVPQTLCNNSFHLDNSFHSYQNQSQNSSFVSPTTQLPYFVPSRSPSVSPARSISPSQAQTQACYGQANKFISFNSFLKENGQQPDQILEQNKQEVRSLTPTQRIKKSFSRQYLVEKQTNQNNSNLSALQYQQQQQSCRLVDPPPCIPIQLQQQQPKYSEQQYPQSSSYLFPSSNPPQSKYPSRGGFTRTLSQNQLNLGNENIPPQLSNYSANSYQHNQVDNHLQIPNRQQLSPYLKDQNTIKQDNDDSYYDNRSQLAIMSPTYNQNNPNLSPLNYFKPPKSVVPKIAVANSRSISPVIRAENIILPCSPSIQHQPVQSIQLYQQYQQQAPLISQWQQQQQQEQQSGMLYPHFDFKSPKNNQQFSNILSQLSPPNSQKLISQQISYLPINSSGTTTNQYNQYLQNQQQGYLPLQPQSLHPVIQNQQHFQEDNKDQPSGIGNSSLLGSYFHSSQTRSYQQKNPPSVIYEESDQSADSYSPHLRTLDKAPKLEQLGDVSQRYNKSYLDLSINESKQQYTQKQQGSLIDPLQQQQQHLSDGPSPLNTDRSQVQQNLFLMNTNSDQDRPAMASPCSENRTYPPSTYWNSHTLIDTGSNVTV